MNERGIKVSFGTLFNVAGEDGRVDVVINTGVEGWCSSAALRENEKGEKSFFLAGSTSRGNIREIIGSMTVEEVLQAAELGAKRAGLKKLPEEMREMLIEYSKAEPRVLE